MALVLTVTLGVLIGLALGMFGGGGSILTVPVLVYVAGVSPTAAIGTSLAVVGATSLTATFLHWRRGRVRVRLGLVFATAGVVTAYLGARVTHLVPDRALMIIFGGLMILIGAWMLRGRPTTVTSDPAPEPKLVYAVLAGAVVGAVTGFLGVGGGFLAVPALIAFSGLDMRAAVGTSLLVITINSAAGFYGHLGDGGLDFRLIVLMTVAAVLGALAGERLAERVKAESLRRGFALLVVVVGVSVAGYTALQSALEHDGATHLSAQQ